MEIITANGKTRVYSRDALDAALGDGARPVTAAEALVTVEAFERSEA